MLYVHIGLRKTGSTSIQKFCSANSELLAGEGVLYTDVGRDGATHHALKNEIDAGKSDELVTALVQQISENPTQNYLISSESFSTLSMDAIQRLITPVSRVTEIRAILYLRSMTSTAVSLYNQATKRSLNTMSFDEYYAHGGGNAKKLSRVVETWGAAIGNSGLRVRTLDAASLSGGGLLTDVLDAVGLPAHLVDQADPDSKTNANVGVTWESAEYIREFTTRMAAFLADADDARRAELTAARRPRLEPVEARAVKPNGRMAMVETLRPKRFSTIVHEALERDGPAIPAQYLTPEQSIELDDRYQRQLERIGELVPGARLSHTATPPPPPRPFLPTYLSVARSRRSAIRDGIRTEYDWDILPKPVRDILTDMDEDPSR